MPLQEVFLLLGWSIDQAQRLLARDGGLSETCDLGLQFIDDLILPGASLMIAPQREEAEGQPKPNENCSTC